MTEDKVKQNGWNEYSRLVLAELKDGKATDDKILDKINDIEKELILLKNNNKDADSIKEDIKDLNTFKTISVTVWAVVQVIFAVAVVLFKK